MWILKPADNEISFIWGNGKPAETHYRLMTYVIRSGDLLLNTVTGELIQLSRQELLLLDNDQGKLTELINKWFLVPEDHNDLQSVQMLRRNIAALHSKGGLKSYTILPTTACNASCFYCYEYGIKKETMTEDRAELTADYIIGSSSGRKIQLRWFGGEPLLGSRTISQICRKLSDAGIEFDSSMVSNGYLFTKEMIREAVELWKLKKVQITLDGTAQTYDRVKGFPSLGVSPFKTVTDNIEFLMESGVHVCIRMNLDMYNSKELECLITYIRNRYMRKDNLSADVVTLYEKEGSRPVIHSCDERNMLEGSRKELKEMLAGCGIKQHGRDSILPKLRTSFCMADNESCVLIAPDGSTGRCEHSIFGDETAGRDQAYWRETDEYAYCAECELYPSCIRLKHCANLKSCNEEIKARRIRDTVGLMKTYLN